MLKPQDYINTNDLLYFSDIDIGLMFLYKGVKCPEGCTIMQRVQAEMECRAEIIEKVNNGSALIEILNCYEDGFDRERVSKVIEQIPLQNVGETDFESFKYMTTTLYTLYVCFLDIVWNVEIDKQKYLCESGSSYEFLSYFIDADMGDAVVTYKYALTENNKLMPYYSAPCVYYALVYQLLDRIKSGRMALNGAMTYHCEQCGKEFIRFTRKKHFCDYCGAGAQRTRKCRERGKNQNAAKE